MLKYLEYMQVEHKTEKGTILFIKVPDEYCYFPSTFSISQSEPLELSLCDLKGEGKVTITLLWGNWIVICLTGEVKDEQAKMMVDLDRYQLGCCRYKNYNSNNMENISPIDSFKSLMQHLQIYEVNPLGYKPDETFNHPNFEFIRYKWDECEKRTGKWLVLFKPE